MIITAIPLAVVRLDRMLRRPLRGFGGVPLIIFALLVAAAIPLSLEGAKAQPIGQSVDDLRDGTSSLSSWVRMSGRIVTISSPESVAAGQNVTSLLVESSGDAIVLLSDRVLEGEPTITGRVNNSAGMTETAVRIAGPRLPPGNLEIIDRYVVSVDDLIVPLEQKSWLEVWIPVGAGLVLLVMLIVGYPVALFRRRPSDRGYVRPLSENEWVDAWLVDRREEDGLRLSAPVGRLQRVGRRSDTDPFFTMTSAATPRPVQFRRHRWSAAVPGTLYFVTQVLPVLRVHDWGIDVLLAFRTEADRDRVLASFSESAGAGEGMPQAAHAARG